MPPVFKDPSCLGQHSSCVRYVHEHVVAVDYVEESIFKGQFTRIGNMKECHCSGSAPG